MTTTEPMATGRFPITGALAVLGASPAPLRVVRLKGTRASVTARLVRLLAPVCLLAAFAALSASPALAAQKRIFTGEFGCAEGAPGCTTPDPYPLAAEPWSVAVDRATGDVYVADGLNHRVEEFTEGGEFLLMFGKEVNPLGATEEQQDVCTKESLVCQPGVPSSAPGGFESVGHKEGGGSEPSPAMFVAVDNAPGGSGAVYVADNVAAGLKGVIAVNRVSKFDASGHLVSSWGEGGELLGADLKGAKSLFGPIAGIAVDPSGNLWVGGEGRATTFEFDQAGGPEPTADWTEPETGTVPLGIAVDSQDNVYFISGQKVREFTAGGGEVGIITEAGGGLERLLTPGAAVDPTSDDVVVLDERQHPTPEQVQLQRYRSVPGCPSPGQHGTNGCPALETYTNTNLTQESLGHGVAVGPGERDSWYVSGRVRGEVQAYPLVTVPGVVTGQPSGVSAASVTLTGSVNPSGVAVKDCFFEYVEATKYQPTAADPYEAGGKEKCAETPTEIGSGTSPVAVHAAISVVASVSYHYRLVADNAADAAEPEVGADVVFGPPLLVSESSVDVSSSVAHLQAVVDPQSVDTRVRVEYGTTAAYSEKTAELDVGAAGVAKTVPVTLEGLSPGTEYHYRFVAESALGEGTEAVVGSDRVFRTQGAGAFRLPDGRAWELVSPRDRHGAGIEPLDSLNTEGEAMQAAVGGGAITYATNLPIAPGASGFPEFAQAISARGPSGWSSRTLSLPGSGTVQSGVADTLGREYRYFSEDLSEAGVQPIGTFQPCESALGAPQPCASPEASEQTAFIEDVPSEVFAPVATGCPSQTEEEEGHVCPPAVAEHADVPPGTHFGLEVGEQPGHVCPPYPYCGPAFVDGNGDFSGVVVTSPVRLTEEPGATAGLYEYAAGGLKFVGAGHLGGNGGKSSTNYRNAISADGSRVFWSQSAHLYMTDTATGEVLQIDAPEPECLAHGECSTVADAEFQFASRDGDRVIFTDGQRLTSTHGGGIYECQITETAGKPACALKDLTPGGAGTIGIFPGGSEDASWVYFVSNSVLGAGAKPGDCHVVLESEAPQNQTCNLYVTHEGTTTLIAVLSGMDVADWGEYGLDSAPTARVSPNGQWLAFMSDHSLTGYDNRDVVSGEPDEEVYLYDATSEQLVCASCDPTGARPHGEQYKALHEGEKGPFLEGGLAGSVGLWYPGTWLAANIPSWTRQTSDKAVYQSRFLSDSGRLFFNTLDDLVPKDGNGQEDVYEYEPQGAGPESARCGPSAASGSEVYKPQAEYEAEGHAGTEGAGCVALISSGTSSEESAFMDASETGGDVFFLSAEHLVPGEIENGESLYDAHECTTSSPCTTATETPPSCAGAEECRAAPEPQPPIYGPPSSATFHGPGNPTPETIKPPPPKPKTAAQIKAEKLKKALRACKKDKNKKKRQACEKQARKAYGAKTSAKKSSNRGKR